MAVGVAFALLLGGCAAQTGDEVGSVSQAIGPDRFLYRAWNGTFHFYTSDFWEATHAPGYTYEGAKGTCWSSNQGQQQQIYRLNKNGFGHLYTVSATEKNNAIAAGWTQETSPCWSDVNTAAGGCLMWRYYKWDTQDHFITSNSSEAFNAGYTAEGGGIGSLENCQ
jgi:hypothetical protein